MTSFPPPTTTSCPPSRAQAVVVAYESDDELDWFGLNLVPTDPFTILSQQFPQYQIWINELRNIHQQNKNWKILFTNETFPLVSFEYYDVNMIKAHLTLYVNPNFPHSPPVMTWKQPRYAWDKMLGVLFFDPFLPKQWNGACNLYELLQLILDFIMPLEPEEEYFIEQPDENVIINFIEILGVYPSLFNTNLPAWGGLYTLKRNEEYNAYSSSGIGYSSHSSTFAYDKFYEHQQRITDIIDQTIGLLMRNEMNVSKLLSFPILPYLISLVKGASLQEYEQNFKLYKNICIFTNLVSLVSNANALGNDSKSEIEQLQELLYALWKRWENIILDGNGMSQEEHEIKEIMQSWIQFHTTSDDPTNGNGNETDCNKRTKFDFTMIMEEGQLNDYYHQEMKGLQYNILEEEFHHHVHSSMISTSTSSSGMGLGPLIKRLRREWNDMQQCDTLMLDGLNGNIYLCWCGQNVQLWKILFTPSHDTPYFGGCFLFDMFIPPDYPKNPPSVHFLTTGHGHVRFNPNLYNSGKVCLSLLGTWEGERWQPELSNITQLAMSILTMIFVDEPYFNEPGYQPSKGTELGTNASRQYNEIIQRHTLQWAVHDMLMNPPLEFATIIHTHFQILWKHLEPEYRKWCDVAGPESQRLLQECCQKIENLEKLYLDGNVVSLKTSDSIIK